jgi:dTDP-4-amino-4,6-dideoxygalactose transaminase
MFPATKCAVLIPKHTYISVPQSVIHAGLKIRWTDAMWCEGYQLNPFNIYDYAVTIKRGMYFDGLMCLSFQIKKKLPIGKGGMILTDNNDAYEWLKKARYEGRDTSKPYDEDQLEFIGWNMYMTPEDAARGLLLFESGMIEEGSICDWSNYPDLSKQEVFKKWTV